MVEQHIRGTDIFLVEVSVKPGNVIRIQLDRPEGISIDACAEISRHMNEMLDRDVEDYSLEVSSPGVGTPFKVKQQYEKNRGHTVDVLQSDGTHLTGTLESISDEGIVLEVKGTTKMIAFTEIKKTKRVISFN